MTWSEPPQGPAKDHVYTPARGVLPMTSGTGSARVDPLQCERLTDRPRARACVADIASGGGDPRPTIRTGDARTELDAASDRVGAK